MPFFFHHSITHNNKVRTLDDTKSKAPKTGGFMGLQFIQSHKKKKKQLIFAVLMLVFEAADRVNRQEQQFVNGFHKMDHRK